MSLRSTDDWCADLSTLHFHIVPAYNFAIAGARTHENTRARTCAGSVALSADVADARRGGFLSSLIRGAARGTVEGAAHNTVRGMVTNPTITTVKTYNHNTLTPAQLEGCVKEATLLDSSSEILGIRTESISAESAAIDQVQLNISRQRALVDSYSEASVNAFNRQLTVLRSRIDRHNATLETARSDENRHNARVERYNADCLGKQYYQSDMDVVKVKFGLNDDGQSRK